MKLSSFCFAIPLIQYLANMAKAATDNAVAPYVTSIDESDYTCSSLNSSIFALRDTSLSRFTSAAIFATLLDFERAKPTRFSYMS